MNNQNKIKLITVLGPTACGKTTLGIEIAKKYCGEIISADSMQIYKGMPIATAKPTLEEMQNIPHHLLSFVDMNMSYSVAEYVTKAHTVITDIAKRNKTPIIVGGTGLYIDSLLNNTQFNKNDVDYALRKELSDILNEKGIDYLLEALAEFDPQSAQRLSVERNPKRIIRAIEVYKTTKITMTEQNINSMKTPSPYIPVKIGLTCKNRDNLYNRINIRVDKMLENGIVEECMQTYNSQFGKTSAKAIGFKEFLPFIKGESSLDECIDKLKTETRRYAKRQLTWFKRDEQINWIYIDEFENQNQINESAFSILKNEGYEAK